MPKPQSFTEFLQDRHAEDYHGLDDEMPDAYEDWITNNVGVDDWIEFAEMWKKEEEQIAEANRLTVHND